MNTEQKSEALRLADALERGYPPMYTADQIVDLLRTLAAEPQFPPDYPDGPDREPAPDAQPVAWVHGNALTALKDHSGAMLDAVYETNKWTSWHDTPLYLNPAQPVTKQALHDAMKEAFSVERQIGFEQGIEYEFKRYFARKPLLASDIVTMYAENPMCDADMIDFARAIERAHGIGVAKGPTP